MVERVCGAFISQRWEVKRLPEALGCSGICDALKCMLSYLRHLFNMPLNRDSVKESPMFQNKKIKLDSNLRLNIVFFSPGMQLLEGITLRYGDKLKRSEKWWRQSFFPHKMHKFMEFIITRYWDCNWLTQLWKDLEKCMAQTSVSGFLSWHTCMMMPPYKKAI